MTAAPTVVASPHRAGRGRAVARITLALACAGAAAAVQAQGWTQVQSSGYAAGYAETTVVDGPVVAGTPGPINLGTWAGGERHYAAASGELQTLRAVAAGSGNGGFADYGNQVSTSSRFSWVTPVDAGSSGLSVGAPITVYLDVRVDGRLAAGFAPFFTHPLVITLPGEYHLETQATASSRYTLYDLDAPGYEGGDPDLEFNYVGSTYMAAAKYGPPYNDQYVQTSFDSQASAARHNVDFWAWAGNDSGSSISHAYGIPSGQTLDVDTGVLRFEVHTFVGHRLELSGELGAYAYGFQGNSENPLSWKALADLGSTFDAELVSSVPGVEFSGLTAGVYVPSAVPEPMSAALMLAGLGSVLAIVGRRRRA